MKLNPPASPSGQWAEKGLYNVVSFINNLKDQLVQYSPVRRRIFLLDDYSAHIGDYVKDEFLKIMPAAKTGDVQGNYMDFHHPDKTYYTAFEMELILVKLRRHPKSIPLPSREKG